MARLTIIMKVAATITACTLVGIILASVTDVLGAPKPVTVGRESFYRLQDVSSMFGLGFGRYGKKSYMMKGKYNTLIFGEGSREARINGTTVWLNAPVQKVSLLSWAVTQTDYDRMLNPILRPELYLGTKGYSVVVLDPGHGGKDTGAISRSGLKEKDLVLDICKRIRAILAQSGVTAHLTRNTDTFIELGDRDVVARKLGASLMVSVHLNAASDRNVKGVETYLLTSAGYASTAATPEKSSRATTLSGNWHDAANAYLGFAVQKSLLKATGNEDRGLRHARFQVLRESTCPSVLVEAGFLSSTREEPLFKTDAYRQKVAQGIATGIIDYIRQVKRARALKK